VIPLSIVIGLTIDRTLSMRASVMSRLAWVSAFLLFLLPATALAGHRGSQYLVQSFTVKRYVPEELVLGDYYQALVVAIGVIFLLTAIARSRILVGAMLTCAVLMANHASTVFIPALTVHKTMKRMCESWRERATAGEPIGFLGEMKHGINFYTDYTVTRLHDTDDFLEFMDPERHAFCIVEKSKIQKADKRFRVMYPGHMLQVVEHSHFDFNLLHAAPVD
jgi:hypothetical protein